MATPSHEVTPNDIELNESGEEVNTTTAAVPLWADSKVGGLGIF